MFGPVPGSLFDGQANPQQLRLLARHAGHFGGHEQADHSRHHVYLPTVQCPWCVGRARAALAMRAIIRSIRSLIGNARRWPARQKLWRTYRAEFARFAELSAADGRFAPEWAERSPQLSDRTAVTSYDAHYVYHTAWAARQVAREKPAEHVDVSSLLYFATLVSAFVPVRFYDYRPADLTLDNLQSLRCDLTNLGWDDGSVASLSCMHTIEHVGLGRYGDVLDARGDVKAAAELSRVLSPNGLLLIVLPVGRARVQFNAHRVYSHEMVLRLFRGLTLEQFALLPDDTRDGLIAAAPPELVDRQSYGCGCFAFRKGPSKASP